jgi:hypothetical protein
LVLGAVVSLAVSEGASASNASISCKEAGALRGPVKDVIVTRGAQHHVTGLVDGQPSFEEELHFSDDRRTLTITTHEHDAPGAPFPRTTCEYDPGGKLVREVLLLDGSTTFTIVEFAYDSDGRLTQSISRSKNPEFNRTISYEYGKGWRAERFTSEVASVTTLTTLDDAGRVVKEVKSNDSEGMIEYRYLGAEIEVCWTENDDHGCIREKRDEHGNRIEVMSPEFNGIPAHTGVERYEYDSSGNWTAHITISSSYRPGPDLDAVVWRKITYR